MKIVVGVVWPWTSGGLTPDYSSGNILGFVFKCKLPLCWHSNAPCPWRKTNSRQSEMPLKMTQFCDGSPVCTQVTAHQTSSMALNWAPDRWSPQRRYFVWNCAKNWRHMSERVLRLCSILLCLWHEVTCVIVPGMTWVSPMSLCQAVAWVED